MHSDSQLALDSTLYDFIFWPLKSISHAIRVGGRWELNGCVTSKPQIRTGTVRHSHQFSLLGTGFRKDRLSDQCRQHSSKRFCDHQSQEVAQRMSAFHQSPIPGGASGVCLLGKTMFCSGRGRTTRRQRNPRLSHRNGRFSAAGLVVYLGLKQRCQFALSEKALEGRARAIYNSHPF